MKIRTLLLNLSLQHIENQSPYLFVFHCSGFTHSQWKRLKNQLHTTNANASACGNGKATSGTLFIPSGRLRLDSPEHSRQNHSKLTFNAGPLCVIYFNQRQNDETITSPSSESCQEKSNDLDKFWSDVVAKISYLEAIPNLVLLYAKMDSHRINHIDLKQALSLTTKSVFQPLLSSILSPSQEFCFNILQPMHELIQSQNTHL
jgi:hypothetical protein